VFFTAPQKRPPEGGLKTSEREEETVYTAATGRM
jgi:hypothetical protein